MKRSLHSAHEDIAVLVGLGKRLITSQQVKSKKQGTVGINGKKEDRQRLIKQAAILKNELIQSQRIHISHGADFSIEKRRLANYVICNQQSYKLPNQINILNTFS